MKLLRFSLVLVPVLCQAAWYKGNLHTHSTDSDGLQPPSQVIQWYKDAGYNFLSMSDHNWFSPTETAGFATTYNSSTFLMLPSEEVTDTSSDRNVIHMLGMNIASFVPTAPAGSNSAVVVTRDAAAIKAAGGVPVYAHPSFTCCPSATDFSLNGIKFMEVYNPAVTTTPNEWMWDPLLSGGNLVYGTASDDTHDLTPGTWSAPGRGWIMVRAASLSITNLLNAMQAGDFYATDGVTLSDLNVTSTSYSVSVSAIAGHMYQIQFIGNSGAVLSTAYGTSATYTFAGSEGYVRARVNDITAYPNTTAWTQPKYVVALPSVTVTVTPNGSTVNAGATKQFNAKVAGSSNTAVTWSVAPSVGTISSTGLYTAPSLPGQQNVTIRATSAANPTVTGTAILTVKAAH